jgi:hypothetical protein
VAEQQVTLKVGFVMATDAGTDPVRCVAQHAYDVSEAWAELGRTMEALADALDVLVSPD